MTKIYGLTNCDSVKKARVWFEKHQIDYEFYDIRKSGLSLEILEKFASRLDDWQILLNRKSTTWRNLTREQQQNCSNIETALPLIVQHETLMKRPIIETETMLIVGFDARIYENQFLCQTR